MAKTTQRAKTATRKKATTTRSRKSSAEVKPVDGEAAPKAATKANAAPAAKAKTASSAKAKKPDDEKLLHVKVGSRTKQSQGKGWNSVLNVAKRFVKNRPNDHLSSLLVELRELNITRKNPGHYYTIKDITRPIGSSILKRSGLEVGDDFYYPDVRAGEYAIGNVSPIRYLANFVRPDTTAIVELGSGWSSNLFQLYIARGATRSKRLAYFGGEYTDEGMICAKYIARVEPTMIYRSFRFDFRDPNITFLSKQRGHILVFTSHSIEQVDKINPSLFKQLADLPQDVTVIHFEPVGWQADKELLQKRTEIDNDFFEKIGAQAIKGNIDSVDKNSAWWSWRLDYNNNLFPILDELEKDNKIEMVRKIMNFNGQANVLNPSSLIHYDFVR